jgi:hypothetical protein
MIYAYRIERLIYNALPQALWWGIFLLMLTVVAIRSLRLEPSRPSRTVRALEKQTSRIGTWRQMVSGMKNGNYSRWLLAREIADLTISVIAHQQRVTRLQARQMLKNGEVDLPGDISEYIQLGLDSPSVRQYTDFLAYMRSGRQSRTLDMDPEIIINYLEEKINSGGLS